MALHDRLFDRLTDDLTTRLSAAATVSTVAAWVGAEPALAGCTLAVDTAAPGGDRRGERGRLVALVRLAVEDRLAGDAAFLSLIRPLRVVAGELVRVWRAEVEEVDQAVAVAGWEQLRVVAGRTLLWPEWAVCGPARDRVRGQLRRQARHPVGPLDGLAAGRLADPDSPDTSAGLEAVDLLGRAVASGAVSASAARLVWEVRALGVPPGEVARRTGRQPAAVRMQLARAEAALRASAGVDGAHRSGRLRLVTPAEGGAAVSGRGA